MKTVLFAVSILLLVMTLPALGNNTLPRQNRLNPSPVSHEQGRRIYLKACAHCHEKGIAGAPRIGDRRAWAVRIPEGLPTLVRHAISGYMCNRGVLPPRGGDRSLSDREIAAATAYMLDKSR